LGSSKREVEGLWHVVGFVDHVDRFKFSGNWVLHETMSLLVVIRIRHVHVEPVAFEGRPFLTDSFVDIVLVGVEIISRISVSWFGNIFVFNVVDSEGSVTSGLGLSPISVFRDTG